MHAVVVAGGVPGPDDPLYPHTRGSPKALLELAEKPMTQWVLDALDGSPEVEAVFLVGVGPSSGLRSRKTLTFVPDQHGLLANSKAGLASVRTADKNADQALVLGGDIPALTPEIVDWRVRSADPSADLDYIAIERRHMEARFPGARRTYVRLRGLEVCGGDINVARIDLATDDAVWKRLLDARKSVWRQAALIGWGTVILLLLGRLKLEDGTEQVSRRLHIRGRAHLCPYAEAGMDVDKPHQLELLRRDLAGPRNRSPE